MIARFVPGALALAGALGAASCCIIPLALIAVGLSGGALMAVTGPVQFLLLPLGWLALAGGAGTLFFRWRRCRAEGCPLAGRAANLALLLVAALLLGAATYFNLFL